MSNFVTGRNIDQALLAVVCEKLGIRMRGLISLKVSIAVDEPLTITATHYVYEDASINPIVEGEDFKRETNSWRVFKID